MTLLRRSSISTWIIASKACNSGVDISLNSTSNSPTSLPLVAVSTLSTPCHAGSVPRVTGATQRVNASSVAGTGVASA